MTKIRIEQLNPIIGDLQGNEKLILNALKQAEQDGIELLILQELAVTGYPVLDILENESFRKKCYATNQRITENTGSTALLFGSITPNEGLGRKMYNSALLAQYRELTGIVHKTLLPTYDVFDDFRYFEPNKEFSCINWNGINLGVTICEDIWYNENEVQYHTYETDPARILKEKGAQVIINISASPYTKSKHENRLKMLQNHAEKLKLPVIYCNQTGAQTDIVFDGDSMAVSSNAVPVAGTVPFEPSFADIVFEPGNNKISALPGSLLKTYPSAGSERQFKAIQAGLRDYLAKTAITEKVVVGLSGGIDSALVCTIAAETLGSKNVIAVTMPSQFSSGGSVSDSEKLANNLGIELHNLAIESVYHSFKDTLKPVFKNMPFGVAEENLQSRIRGALLMALTNKFGYFLLATGNKSEYAVGYATLYGDMNGALAVIGDLYKSEVYELSRWLNNHYFKKEVIPESIITKPPSAELRPGQKDSDSLPEYEVLDDILYHYIELQENAVNIIAAGYKQEIVEKVIRMVDYNEFKRFQAAPIIKLSSKAFGSGRRWPIVQQWTSNHKK